MKYRLLALLFLIPFFLQAQTDEAEIRATIMVLFDGMRQHDTTMMASAFLPDAQLIRVGHDPTGELKVQASDLQGFLNNIAAAKELRLDEQLYSFDIRVDPPLATAWTDYSFFVNEQLHHCGINTFTLYQTEKGWKIARVEDTGHAPSDCNMTAKSDREAIALLLDNFHKAAAEADEDTFFGSMTEDGMYLGTDASERWLRDELKEWSKEYFDRESAWSFAPTQRHIYFADDGTTAWFDELLDTWMGVCRGSGVLVKTEKGWKIKQYNLTVAVPNDVVQEYIKLLPQKED